MEEEVLEPKKSIILDCSMLSTFFGKEFDIVFGFMIGKLTPLNRFEWERVLREVYKVLKSRGKVLFTVSSEEEAEIVKEILKRRLSKRVKSYKEITPTPKLVVKEILKGEFDGVIKENKDSDGYLDHWVYTGVLRE